MTNHHSAITGEFVTAEHAKNNPDTTVSESRDDLAAELRRLRGVNHNLQVALHGANVKLVELEANLDHLRTEDIPVIQQRRDELIARVAELEELVEVEYAGRMRLAAMVRSIRAYCEALAEGSEGRDPEPWNPAAYVLAILDSYPDANSNSKPPLGVGLEPIAFDPPLTDDEAGAFLDAITTDEADQ